MTLAIPVRTLTSAVSLAEDRAVERGCSGEDIVACLERNGARATSSRRAGRLTICSRPGNARALEPHDFLVAIAGGRVVGCAAMWDQRGFKQVDRPRLFAGRWHDGGGW